MARTPAVLQRLGRFLDWEDWLTLGLMLGAILAVSTPLESGGWSRHMPPITTTAVLAALAAMLIARSRLSVLLAWPLALAGGLLVTFWQTLNMAGPGGLWDRLDAIYYRFDTWFDIAIHGGVSNDSLPFNVLVVGITWLGVFLFGWSVYRWHNAWLGLLPGAVTLFVDMAFIGDPLSAPVAVYVLFGFLLVMRTNLMSRIADWRAKGISYPPMVSITFLNFSTWALLALLVGAWIAPVGPFATPGPVQALVDRIEITGVHFIRLAGPLQTKKIIPVHDYSGVLPFQGSIEMGDRQVLTVKVQDTSLQGPFALRGTVYDKYGSGGWEAGDRREVPLPSSIDSLVRDELLNQSLKGELVSINVTVDAQSVVGGVLFTPGQVVSSNPPANVDMPQASLLSQFVHGGSGLNNVPNVGIVQVAPEQIGVAVTRDRRSRIRSIDVFNTNDQAVPDSVELRPADNHLDKGSSYSVTGFIPDVTPDDLRTVGQAYPDWVAAQYLQLPDSLPDRVRERAQEIAQAAPTPYDKAKAVEDYLRQFPVDYNVKETPPGRDSVDYFLFESQRGYFDYHASAMVVMLRSLGVAARLAVGFVVDQSDQQSDTGAYAVRDRNSYAWAEVYFPKYGWIPFNPSPDRPADLTPQKKTQDPPSGGTATGGPNDRTLDAGSIFPPDSGADSQPATSFPTSGSGTNYTTWAVIAAVAAFAAALAASATLGWRRSVAGLPYSQEVWEKTVRLASWAGYPPQPGQTPSDYARRLERVFRGFRDIPLLATAYSRSRFGHHEATSEEQDRIRGLWPHLRKTLLGAIAVRFVRRRR